MMAGGAPNVTLDPARQESVHHRHRLALSDARHHLKRSALKLAGYLGVAYVVLKLLPALKQALHSLEHVSWEWVLGAIALEAVAATGLGVVGLIARRASNYAERLQAKRPKIAGAITTIGAAVEDTGRLLFHRGGRRSLVVLC